MRARDLGRAGERDAGDARIRRPAPRRPRRRRARDAARDAGTPASCSSATASAAISGVCSAGLATTRIAGDERGRDLAEEDREREIPRADADEHAAAAMMQLVGLAGRARHRLRDERAARLGGVVAAEVDRLAHLGERIVERLAAFGLQQRDQPPSRFCLEEIGGALERGARAPRPGVALPRRESPSCAARASTASAVAISPVSPAVAARRPRLA